jgi:hypothetical protein
MNSKPDIEYEERGDISLLSEIITNLMYWQEIVRRKSVKLGENLEDIINIAEVKRISIYHQISRHPSGNLLPVTTLHIENLWWH